MYQKFKLEMVEAKVVAKECGLTSVKVASTGVWSAQLGSGRGARRVDGRSSAELIARMKEVAKPRPKRPVFDARRMLPAMHKTDVAKWEKREAAFAARIAAYRARLFDRAMETREQLAERKQDAREARKTARAKKAAEALRGYK